MMIVKANAHIGFNCKYLEKTLRFYKDIMECRETFTLYYRDLIPKDQKRIANISAEQLEEWKKHKDEKWIIYLEWTDGYYIELFNEYNTTLQLLDNFCLLS